MQESKFYKLEDKSLIGNVTATMQVQDYFDCSFLCLEHGPSACLSFNVGKTNNNGYYTCELSNSERYLEPHRVQLRASYDYYETGDLVIETSNQGVFHAAIGLYRLNFYDARRLCEILGAALATYKPVARCMGGWSSEMLVFMAGLLMALFAFPMHTALKGCGNHIGISGSSTPKNKSMKFDAWCYKE
ncbi:stabilin 1 [Desmophyllum pertusum]|uniref:Stabilin 1 n=1 Tax=Desmophyllum pertusum TaxID=174260 RepID=A0A9X0CPN5_9CNID|nr:stabilin 1 [Desmophyllum pertusum]